jgi:hypothetical protein
MKALNKYATMGAAALLALAYGTSALAAPASITCVVGEDRTVTLNYDDADATVSCYGSGSTPPAEGTYFTDLGYTQLEKINYEGDNETDSGTYITSISGLNGTSGNITLIDGLVDAILVFKFGSGGIEPDWIAFNVSGDLSASWSVDPAVQALSHVTLYGTPPTSVPEPTTLALLGLGLVAVGYRARRRQKI